MSEGYDPASSSGARFARLDEFLCDYVDGTMDPSARLAFEEYLRANPDLAAHVHTLYEARQVLCRCGRRLRAPAGFQAQLRRQLTCEVMRAEAPRYATLAPRLSTVVMLASTAAVLVMVGMLVGATVFSDGGPAMATMEQMAPDRPAVGPVRMVPRWQPQYRHAVLSGGPMTPALGERPVARYGPMADMLLDPLGLQRTGGAP